MVSYYKTDKKTAAVKAIEVKCQSLDIQGRGVCKHDGMVYFVENLLPGEVARVSPKVLNNKSKDNVCEAQVTKYISLSQTRRAQSCPLQQECGGCPIEHIPLEQAFEAKIAGVSKLLQKSVIQGTKIAKATKASSVQGSSRLGRNSTIKQALAKKQAARKNEARNQELNDLCAKAAESIKEPAFKVSSSDLAYRRACRLAIRGDHGKLHLGFRESKTQDLVPVVNCEVLTERNNALLGPLKELVNLMQDKKSIGHVELLDSDGAVGVLMRMTKSLCNADEVLLKDFANKYKTVMSVLEPYKQLDDTEVVRERVLNEDEESLYVMSHDCKILCSPSSFVQINSKVNQSMIEHVLEQVQPHENLKVLDLFSGLGNFSLPIAKANASVVGIDIVSDMVRRANENAKLNGIAQEKARFYVADLEEPFESQLWAQDKYDVVVMDPGRMGAKRAVLYMSKLKAKKIIMISCNPLAAARDCAQLVSSNYKLQSWGAFDMFPRTSHLEIMMTFVLEQ